MDTIHDTLDEKNRQARLNFLLQKTEIFSHFLEGTADTIKEKTISIDCVEETEVEITERKQIANSVIFQDSPNFITGGEMRDYQIRGLNWLINLYKNGINGILADEMGLGKTLQTISLLGYMKIHGNNPGPHIVICPKSTLANWKTEFSRWCPSLNVICLMGNKDERNDFITNVVFGNKQNPDWNVLLTTYEVCMKDKSRLKKVNYGYLVIDEAHRIKNEKSKLSEIVREFSTRNRLLLTGTPLQNNLHELWALLNFLLPDIFSNSDDFDSWFNMDKMLNNEEDSLISRLHSILQPFLLRRLKSEVETKLLPKKETKIYVGLSSLQRQWYTAILLKDIDLVNTTAAKANRSGLLNILMQLRKCCNHPYLFNDARPEGDEDTNQQLIESSGKLKVLDKLFARLYEQKSRVLIFSQMTRMLDILEEFVLFRGYSYCRIDGQTPHESRKEQIEGFNAPNSDIFAFLLSTRAGGLGINLASADIVVLYDSDWNPQMDLQAMDRAHRIGQKKQVKVFRFITENTVEERILEKAELKLRLDNIVIQQGRLIDPTIKIEKDEILTMIRSGAEKVFASKDSTITDEDIDIILKKGEMKTAELEQKYKEFLAKAGGDPNQLRNFSMEQNVIDPIVSASGENTKTSVYNFEGEDYRTKHKPASMIGFEWLHPPKRERRSNYSVEAYYNDLAATPQTNQKSTYKSAPKPTKFPSVYDFQFYDSRLYQLLDKELYHYRYSIEFKEMLNPSLTKEEAEAFRQKEQDKIDAACDPLTEEEIEAKEKLLATTGFPNWTKKEYAQFLRNLEKHGLDNWDAVANEFENKTLEDVLAYSSIFMERIQELDDFHKIENILEKTKLKKTRQQNSKEALTKKFSLYQYPLYQLKINYGPNKGKTFSEEEDRFILCLLYRIGLDSPTVYEEIVEAIKCSPRFRFDWFLRSRTPDDIKRRSVTLINLIEREFFEDSANLSHHSSVVNTSLI